MYIEREGSRGEGEVSILIIIIIIITGTVDQGVPIKAAYLSLSVAILIRCQYNEQALAIHSAGSRCVHMTVASGNAANSSSK